MRWSAVRVAADDVPHPIFEQVDENCHCRVDQDRDKAVRSGDACPRCGCEDAELGGRVTAHAAVVVQHHNARTLCAAVGQVLPCPRGPQRKKNLWEAIEIEVGDGEGQRTRGVRGDMSKLPTI
eukprot:CAMPEP_0182847602 /NCGR_PEP_ID=MMETSP0006_2-20121128/28547_1 /TAXON_ID=97485 /ORGANISM="Prymnesium parvum, Strain Texoma1" /LENGTH=122 /DNA_ID=CAMNT_0024977949 /DNA_START=1077 /DNA_END=1446 /DNA_ORIENTATION=-